MPGLLLQSDGSLGSGIGSDPGVSLDPMSLYQQYRGIWGGRISVSGGGKPALSLPTGSDRGAAAGGPEGLPASGESTEEMWWSEPSVDLLRGVRLSRLKFLADTRQYLLVALCRRALAALGCTNGSSPKIIDFGCGTGGTTLNLAAVLGRRIDGFDLFPTQIGVANAWLSREGANGSFQVLRPDGTIPLDGASVDLVLSADVLGHVPSIPAVLRDFSQVLVPGGQVVLYTEAAYSPEDRSLAHRLCAQTGVDLFGGVPEHISMHPREDLERFFDAAGFEVVERYSGNVMHALFFPKHYVELYARAGRSWSVFAVAFRVWNRLSRILPFYPMPIELLRLALTALLGSKAYGTSYFYRLKKMNLTSAPIRGNPPS